ncbi:hypothetical protein L1049_028192 [Liquidambar formosana]|uniref:Uncharacterized protein n=1 Tax=Liquidambar formosana TaxID=63359 RepID=A0AAP0WT29_LIQFO
MDRATSEGSMNCDDAVEAMAVKGKKGENEADFDSSSFRLEASVNEGEKYFKITTSYTSFSVDSFCTELASNKREQGKIYWLKQILHGSLAEGVFSD